MPRLAHPLVRALCLAAALALLALASPTAPASAGFDCMAGTFPANFTNVWNAGTSTPYLTIKSTHPRTPANTPTDCWGSGVTSWGPGVGLQNNSFSAGVAQPMDIHYTGFSLIFVDSSDNTVYTENIPTSAYPTWYAHPDSDWASGRHADAAWSDPGDLHAGCFCCMFGDYTPKFVRFSWSYTRYYNRRITYQATDAGTGTLVNGDGTYFALNLPSGLSKLRVGLNLTSGSFTVCGKSETLPDCNGDNHYNFTAASTGWNSTTTDGPSSGIHNILAWSGADGSVGDLRVDYYCNTNGTPVELPPDTWNFSVPGGTTSSYSIYVANTIDQLQVDVNPTPGYNDAELYSPGGTCNPCTPGAGGIISVTTAGEDPGCWRLDLIESSGTDWNGTGTVTLTSGIAAGAEQAVSAGSGTLQYEFFVSE